MKYTEGLNRLKARKDTRFVLSGDEPYLKDQFVKAARVFYPDARYLVFYPEDQEEALGALSAGFLFENRVLVFLDFDQMRLKDFIGPLEGCDSLVVMVLSDGASLIKRDVTKIISLSTHVQINKMKEYGSEYPRWILSKAHAADYEMRNGAEDLLYEMVGPDMFQIASEFKKLLLYKSEDREINPSDVTAVVSRTAQKSAYDIMERLLRKDVSGSLEFFRSYARYQDNFIELVSFLGKYMEKFYRVLLLREEKMNPDAIGGIVGIHPYLLKTKYLNRVVALGKGFIGKCYGRLCDLDVGLRTFKGEKRILVENFILEMTCA